MSWTYGNVVKTYEKDSTFVCPAGITRVDVSSYEHDVDLVSIDQNSGAIDLNGVAYTWGFGTSGQLGDNSIVTKSSPVAVAGTRTVKQIVTAGVSLALLTTDGEVYCCGAGIKGGIGDSTVVAKSTPVVVAGTLRFKKIALTSLDQTNGQCVLALDSNGDLYSWGDNTVGNLGDGTVVSKSSPTLIPGGKKWKDVTSNCSQAAYAIDDSDAAYCWGLNTSGRLGDGTTVDKSSPVLVVGSLKVKRIGDGILLTTGGVVYCFGANAAGQLGDGTIVAKSSPVLVVGLPNTVVEIGWCGNGIATTKYALTDQGDLYVWGNNTNGVFGTGLSTPAAASSPILVAAGMGLKWIKLTSGSIAVGAQSYGAVASNGQIYTWGANGSGQLGQNTVTTQSSPVVVVGLKNFGNKRLQRKVQSLKTVPGTSYAIVVNKFQATFGNIVIGQLAKGIQVRY